jgi:hypothetical protein
MITITIDEFKTQFPRSFTFSETLPDIRDADIAEAIVEANCVFNQDLYPDEDCGKKALFYLSAHFLVRDIDAADMGGQSAFIQSSRSVNGMSESLAAPDWMNEGDFAYYATTAYGQKFLILTKPYLTGVMYAVEGLTLP